MTSGSGTRWLGAMAVGISLLCSVCSAGAAASARQPSLHVTFHRSGEAAAVLSDQRYAFVAPPLPTQPGVLFDDVAHRHRSIPQDGCEPAGSALSVSAFSGGPQLSGGLLAFQCPLAQGSSTLVYSIPRRTWRTVAFGPVMSAACGPSPAPVPAVCSAGLIEAGSQWLEFSGSNCPEADHCYSASVFQNINTGHVARDPAVQGGRQIPDLDSPTLAHQLCAPLTIPEGFNMNGPAGPGVLSFQGRFALALGAGTRGGTQTYLEKCGTHLHQLITSTTAAEPQPPPVAASPHAIAWPRASAQLNIEFLPSRQRFSIPLPKNTGSGIAALALALTDHRLYVVGENHALWIANVPAKPPSS